MPLKIIQLCIVVFVIGSNIKHHWTPNPVVAGLVALFTALLATVIIRDSLRFYRWTLQRFDQR